MRLACSLLRQQNGSATMPSLSNCPTTKLFTNAYLSPLKSVSIRLLLHFKYGFHKILHSNVFFLSFIIIQCSFKMYCNKLSVLNQIN